MSQEAKITISRSSYSREKDCRGIKLLFSPNRCFAFDGGEEDQRALAAIARFIKSKKGFALAGCGELTKALLEPQLGLTAYISCVISDDPKLIGRELAGKPVVSVSEIPQDVRAVFHGQTLTVKRNYLARKIPPALEQFGAEVLTETDLEVIPSRAWFSDPDCIYPLNTIPEIEFLPNQDLILIDCPARNLSLMPNGLAYVYNALKNADIVFQTVDLDIITYHRYHTYRLLDAKEPLTTPKGKPMRDDPWLAEYYDDWQDKDVIAYFNPELEEIVEKLIAAKPKILGVSVQGCNHLFTEEVVRRVRLAAPEIIVLAGGYSCYQSTIGLNAFPLADYMCIGEADTTIGGLVEKLARGEKPRDLPGVMSVNDTPGWTFVDKEVMPMQLDDLAMARYDWTDLKLYVNHNHYQLTPIIATRGCRWSKCTFCAERFYWRARDPKLVVDEFEYLHDNGCDLFMFNESDLNGRPDLLLAICEEIQRRKLKIKLTGQLRVSRHSDRKFYDALAAGGFSALRFGVDAWSANTLKLQMKGYTVPMIEQNLRDCTEAGIYTEVNTVLGIPGETDQDILETIDLKAKCKPWVGRVANINTLMLVVGSVYWEKPEKFGIKFHNATKEQIFKRFPRYIPDEFWHSEEPYIDGKVRLERLIKVVEGMKAAGYDVGPFAARVIDKIVETGTNAADWGVHIDVESSTTGTQITMKEKGKPAAEPPIRVNCILPQETAVRREPLVVIRRNQEFYGIFDPPVPAPAQPLTLRSIPRRSYRAIRAIVSPPKIYRSSDLDQINFRVLTTDKKIKKEFPRQARVEVVRDWAPLTRLIQENVHGYNIVQVRNLFYGIRQGFPFDKDRADLDRYEPKICFKGPTGKSVVEQIEKSTGVQSNQVSRNAIQLTQ